MQSETCFLELKNISKSFAGVPALRNVSLQIRKGEVHALCGENGAGKSTLIKILSGVYQPDNGDILIQGQKIKAIRPLMPASCQYPHCACFFRGMLNALSASTRSSHPRYLRSFIGAKAQKTPADNKQVQQKQQAVPDKNNLNLYMFCNDRCWACRERQIRRNSFHTGRRGRSKAV